MKLKIKKGTVETSIIFLLSPFLSFPFILNQLKSKDRAGSLLLSFLVGLIGYLYIPSISNDKARYYERFELYSTFDFSSFTYFIFGLKKPDFIFDFVLYVASQLGIKIEFVFFILTWLCVYLLFLVINSIITSVKPGNWSYILISLLTLLSFSLPSLLSGLRFTLGATMFIYGVYSLFFTGAKAIRGILIIILATQTHFSLLYFVPSLFLIYFDPKSRLNYRIFFLISFIFLLIPSSITSQIFGSLSISESLDSKTSVYVNGEDFVSKNFDSNQNSILIYLFRTAWYYFMLAYLLYKNKSLIFNRMSEKLINIIYLFIFFVNFTFSFTTVFSRFTIVLKIIFAIFLIYKYLYTGNQSSKRELFLLLSFYLLAFLVDVFVLRFNLQMSLFSGENLSMLQILFHKISPNEFLK